MNHSLLRIAIVCTTIAIPALSQDIVAIKAKTIHTPTRHHLQDRPRDIAPAPLVPNRPFPSSPALTSPRRMTPRSAPPSTSRQM